MLAGEDSEERRGQVLTLLVQQALCFHDYKAANMHCQELMAMGEQRLRGPVPCVACVSRWGKVCSESSQASGRLTIALLWTHLLSSHKHICRVCIY